MQVLTVTLSLPLILVCVTHRYSLSIDLSWSDHEDLQCGSVLHVVSIQDACVSSVNPKLWASSSMPSTVR